jgi:hypothetical protein
MAVSCRFLAIERCELQAILNAERGALAVEFSLV